MGPPSSARTRDLSDQDQYSSLSGLFSPPPWASFLIFWERVKKQDLCTAYRFSNLFFRSRND
ncbi:uncharacterized protein Dvar_04280 [Desulfosarcina variabilis str. Montpellier]